MKGLKERYDVIVIGAGMGGLTCGALLAKQGISVLLAEQSSKPGGYCTSIKENEFSFDPAVSILEGCDEGGVIARTLADLNTELELVSINPISGIIGPDYDLTVARRLEGFEEQLRKISPSESENIHRFLEECKALYKEMGIISKSSPDLMGFGQKIAFMKDFLLKCPKIRKYSGKSAKEVVQNFFSDPKLRAIIHGLTIFLDSEAQATILMNMFGMMGQEDVFYPKRGGIQTLPDILTKSIGENGGTITLNTRVTRILLDGDTAAGVELEDGSQIRAKCLVSNVDGRQTFLNLIGEDKLSQKFVRDLKESKAYGSAVSVSLGVDMDLRAKGMKVSNLTYCPTNDVDKLFGIEPAKCGLSIRLHSLLDPTQAPRSKSTVGIVANFPYESMEYSWWDENNKQYRKAREIVGDKLVAAAEKVIPGLSENIVYKRVDTPITFEKTTGNFQGSAMGWYPLPGGKMRSQKTPIKNLFQAGHWTFPGGSVPAVIASGRNAAQLVLNCLERED